MSIFSSDPYSAFAIAGETPSYKHPVLIFPETQLNIAPNNAAHYNASSGKYCAEYYGTYQFQLHLYKTGPTSGAPYCAIVKESQSGSTASLAWVFTYGNTIGGSTSTIVDLEQGDCVYVGHCSETSKLSDKTAFSGTLLNLLH